MKKPNNDYRFIIPKKYENVSIKQLREKVEDYLLPYVKYKIVLETNFEIKEITDEKMKNYVSYIELVLKQISSCSRGFLEQEYLVPEKNKKWWVGIYSKTTFTILKRNAYCEFLNYVME